MFMRYPLAVALAVSLLGCGVGPDEILQQARLRGDSGTLAGVQVESWATLGPGGTVERVGLTLPALAVQQAGEAQALDLALPLEVRQATFLDHLRVDYSVRGQGPVGSYKGGRFEFRFFGIDAYERALIDCSDEPMPTATTLPEGYLVPGTGPAPAGSCLQGLGVHAYDPGTPGLDASSDQPLTSALILGYHRGTLAFVEGLVTETALADGGDFALAVPALGLLGDSTLLPRTVVGQYDADGDSYLIFVEDFAPAG